MQRFLFVLPPELQHRKGDPAIQRKVNAAWFHRSSVDAFTNEHNDFSVEIDGCTVQFSLDEKLCGRYQHVRYKGDVVTVVRGAILHLTKEKEHMLAGNLKRLENEMNVAIKNPPLSFGVNLK